MNRDSLTQTNYNEDTVRRYLALMGRYELLLEISRRLNSELDLSSLLHEIIEASTELTDTEVASILLVDPASGELRFEAGMTPGSGSGRAAPALEKIVVPMEGSIAGWIVRHGEPMLIEDVRNHPRHFNQVDESMSFSTRNMLGVPLRTHDKIIGALEAINKRNDQAFTEDDVNTLTALAAQAAVAIENARLFQQSDLIAEMVHELRAPLAAIMASAHLLKRVDLDEARRDKITGTIQSEAQRLNNMTTDFLDLSRLESGRTRLEKVRFEVEPMLEEAVEVVRQQAADREIVINVECEANVPILEADRGKLKQVLLNLLTNAIKYNIHGGRIFIRAEIIAPEIMVRISVRDTGKGIPDDAKEHIFERFYRVPDTEGYAQGTGLGLAIAKRIVETHEGDMWLESQVGVGTTFYFTIPITEEGFQPPIIE